MVVHSFIKAKLACCLMLGLPCLISMDHSAAATWSLHGNTTVGIEALPTVVPTMRYAFQSSIQNILMRFLSTNILIETFPVAGACACLRCKTMRTSAAHTAELDFLSQHNAPDALSDSLRVCQIWLVPPLPFHHSPAQKIPASIDHSPRPSTCHVKVGTAVLPDIMSTTHRPLLDIVAGYAPPGHDLRASSY